MGITGTFEGWVSDILVIYNNGSWNHTSSPGATRTAGVTNGCILYPYREVLGSDITYYDAIIRLNSVFNVTNYNYLKVSYTMSGDIPYTTINIGISSSQNVKSLKFTATATLQGSGTCISNISSISGDYYIYIGARSVYLYDYRPTVKINTIVVSKT